jgi:hypothetical protein
MNSVCVYFNVEVLFETLCLKEEKSVSSKDVKNKRVVQVKASLAFTLALFRVSELGLPSA